MKRSCCEALNAYDEGVKIRELVAHYNPLYFNDIVKNGGVQGLHSRFQEFPTMIFANITTHRLKTSSNSRMIACVWPWWGCTDKAYFEKYNDYVDGEDGPTFPNDGLIAAATFNDTTVHDGFNKLPGQTSDEMGEQLLTGDWAASRTLAWHGRLRFDLNPRYKTTGKVKMCCLTPVTSTRDFNIPIKTNDFKKFPYPSEHDLVADGEVVSLAAKVHTGVGCRVFPPGPTRVLTELTANLGGGNFSSTISQPANPVIPQAPTDYMGGMDHLEERMYHYKDLHSTNGSRVIDCRCNLGPTIADSGVNTGTFYSLVGKCTAYHNHKHLDDTTADGMAAGYRSTGGNMYDIRNRHLGGGVWWRADLLNDGAAFAADVDVADYDQITLYEMLKSDATGPLVKAWNNIKASGSASVMVAGHVLGLGSTEARNHVMAETHATWGEENTTALTSGGGSMSPAIASPKAWYSGLQDLWHSYKEFDDGLRAGPIGTIVGGYIEGQTATLKWAGQKALGLFSRDYSSVGKAIAGQAPPMIAGPRGTNYSGYTVEEID